MERKRVLILDLHDEWADLPDDVEVDVEKALFRISDNAVYSAIPRVLEFLGGIGDRYNLIVVGNNLGAGLEKAKALNPILFSHVIVCWNDEPSPKDIAPYKNMGISHFVSRAGLAQYIQDHPEIYS